MFLSVEENAKKSWHPIGMPLLGASRWDADMGGGVFLPRDTSLTGCKNGTLLKLIHYNPTKRAIPISRPTCPSACQADGQVGRDGCWASYVGLRPALDSAFGDVADKRHHAEDRTTQTEPRRAVKPVQCVIGGADGNASSVYLVGDVSVDVIIAPEHLSTNFFTQRHRDFQDCGTHQQLLQSKTLPCVIGTRARKLLLRVSFSRTESHS